MSQRQAIPGLRLSNNIIFFEVAMFLLTVLAAFAASTPIESVPSDGGGLLEMVGLGLGLIGLGTSLRGKGSDLRGSVGSDLREADADEYVPSIAEAMKEKSTLEAVRPEDAIGIDELLEGKADEDLVRIAAASGLPPEIYLRAIQAAAVNIQSADGFQEQSTGFATVGSTATPYFSKDLTSTAQVSVTVADGFSGTCFVGGYVEFRAYRGGNSENGELVDLWVYGRKFYPEHYVIQAGGEGFRLAWNGPFAQNTHYFKISSPQGDATNPVTVAMTARSRALTVDDVRTARRYLPRLMTAFEGIHLNRWKGIGRMALRTVRGLPAMRLLEANAMKGGK